jgi:hypothetical protein
VSFHLRLSWFDLHLPNIKSSGPIRIVNDEVARCYSQYLSPSTFSSTQSIRQRTVTLHTRRHRSHHHLYPSIKSAKETESKMGSNVAQKRLFHEYKNLSTNPPEGITAGPITEDDMFHWEALIQGPEGTPFEGGVFAAELKFPKDYPLSPPTMKFLGGVWHPNGIFSYKIPTCWRFWKCMLIRR